MCNKYLIISSVTLSTHTSHTPIIDVDAGCLNWIGTAASYRI